MIDLHLVVDEFKFRGYDATLEGGGAAIPFIFISLSDNRVATYAPCLGLDCDGGWGGMVYPSSNSFWDGIDDDAKGFDVAIPIDCEVASKIVDAFIFEVRQIC